MADVQSMLSSVIGAGKIAHHKIGADEIRRLIENQPDTVGEVDVEVVGDGGEVGASSGIVAFDATFDAGQGRVTANWSCVTHRSATIACSLNTTCHGSSRCSALCTAPTCR